MDLPFGGSEMGDMGDVPGGGSDMGGMGGIKYPSVKKPFWRPMKENSSTWPNQAWMNLNADINGDKKIGIAEAILILRQLSM